MENKYIVTFNATMEVTGTNILHAISEAHRLLKEKGLAYELYHIGKIDERHPTGTASVSIRSITWHKNSDTS